MLPFIYSTRSARESWYEEQATGKSEHVQIRKNCI